jgi:hypothetical protein
MSGGSFGDLPVAFIVSDRLSLRLDQLPDAPLARRRISVAMPAFRKSCRRRGHHLAAEIDPKVT